MAESTLSVDMTFSPPSTKHMPNGHTGMSHDSHTTHSFPLNGISEGSASVPTATDAFEDSFVTFNGAVEYEDPDDDFVDPLELARIRHLSTINEAPVEASNSNSENEDDDYIMLNKVSVSSRQGTPDLATISEENGASTQAEGNVSSDSEHEYDQVALEPKPIHNLSAFTSLDFVTEHENTPQPPHGQTTPSNMKPVTALNAGPGSDQVEVEFGSPQVTTPTATTPTVTVEGLPQAHDYVNVKPPSKTSVSPDLLSVTDATSSLSTVVDTDRDTAQSPNRFLAMLSDALAAPPVLDDSNQGEGGDEAMQGMFNPPDDWLLQPGEEGLAMDLGETFLISNLLPMVTPLEQCLTTDIPVCPDIPSPSVLSTMPTLGTDSTQHQATVESDEEIVTTNTVEGDTVSKSDSQANSDSSTLRGDSTELGDRSSMGTSQVSSNLRPRYVNVTVGAGTGVHSAVPVPAKRKYINVTVGMSGSPSAVPMPMQQQIISETIEGHLCGATAAQSEGDNLHNSTDLDHGTRAVKGHGSPLGPTLSSPGGSPVILRRKIGDSPLTRRRNITSSPVHPRREELGGLQPLSPEHGTELSDQYDFLRRTLSHSHRRFSTRRRPNRKGRTQEDGSGAGADEGDPGLDTSLAHTERADAGQKRMRDILLSSEVSSSSGRNEGLDTRIDHHGRTYYMDHSTRTVDFNGHRRGTHHGRPTSSDLENRREMLERRYRSLNRSFRRNERPPVPSRRGQRSSAVPMTSSNLEDNLTLTLTREEADAMMRRGSTLPSSSPTSKSKKKRNSSGSSRRWPFSRKSSKSITQQGSTSGDDDILVVSPSVNGNLEFGIPDSPTITRSSTSPQRSTSGSIGSESSQTRNLEVISGSNDDVIAAVGVTSEQSVGDNVEHRGETVAELQQGGSQLSETTRLTSPEVSDLDRHDAIVRASWLSRSDRAAAQVARNRASTRRGERRDSDEITNEGSHANTRSVVIEPRTPDSPLSPGEPSVPEEEEEVKEKLGERQLNMALSNSPALRFITRRDLFSFLSSAGNAGKDFIASRALMELVQRIRSDHFLLDKYQHSRHLVNALNRFADQQADLPEGWEKKLNQQGKIFFIDHKYKVTTFIDPRLPLPDTVFTYTTQDSRQSIMSTRRSALFSEDSEMRPHHVTTSSSALSDMSTPSESTTPAASGPPTPTGSDVDGDSVSEGATNSPPTYEAQVVGFFQKPDVVDIINSRYQRGVRPQFRNIIEEIRLHGIPALERIQMSGSIAAYELALVLSLFEEDIARVQPSMTPVPTLVVNEPHPSPSHPTTNTTNTLQRKKEAFSTKLQHFKIMMVRMGFAQGSRLKFNIRRKHLLEDAYEHVMKSDIKQLQTKRLNIAFRGEEGLDYGGPSREFFFLLSREIFNPYYGLFEYSANDTYTVQVNPTSEFLQNSLDWFRFAGRIVGLVIIQGFLLDAFFTRTVYKTFLSRPPTLKDLEALEPAFYNSLLWIRENDPEPLDLTFTVEEEAFGQLRTHQLKDSGLDLPVTEDNKEEYISLMLKWRLDRGVAKQMEALKKGFSEVMPPHLLVDFDAHELEFITAGTVEIDIDDWRSHTEYRNGYHPTHPVIVWFWRAVEAFDNEQRLRLLQFVTGTSSVPFEGFKALRGSNGLKRFTIDYYNDINAFPRTHTCFNRIDLPPYSSYEVLSDKLLFAVQEGGGFGIE